MVPPKLWVVSTEEKGVNKYVGRPINNFTPYLFPVVPKVIHNCDGIRL